MASITTIMRRVISTAISKTTAARRVVLSSKIKTMRVAVRTALGSLRLVVLIRLAGLVLYSSPPWPMLPTKSAGS
jgi:uncharacterized membrane protein